MKSARLLLIIIGVSAVALGLLKIGLDVYGSRTVLAGCHPDTNTGLVDSTATVGFWQNHPINPPLAMRDTLSQDEIRVLGTTIPDDKWIEIDLQNQRLTAHDGNDVFLETPISSGLYDSTPVGEYHIWYKIRATLMEGGNRMNNTYYYLPNVPYAMFFYGDYAIHGVYWHSNFGEPMSHGCINAPTSVAEKLFYWTDPQLPPGRATVTAAPDDPGTRVVIHR